MGKNTKGSILVVDDEANAREALKEMLADDGYTTHAAADGREALRAMQQFEPDVVLTDLKMPGMDGLALLTEGRKQSRHSAFVVMTAFGSIETAVEAIKRGAEHYITKPLEMDAVTALVERAMEKAHLSREAARLREQIESRYQFDQILGTHPSMQRLLKTLIQVSKSRATVLISGESGTGKELIASAIHHNSKRKAAAFVRLNCASLAESLLESELFGHERGAFTGAIVRREGRFEQANGGTLFLDEVSEIPMTLQVKLLRFLQERTFERVGGNQTIQVDVRIVAATNRDLAEQVRLGTFREDLFYRLNVVQLEVPPLRARASDIPALALHFLRKYAMENEVEVSKIGDEAMRALAGHSFPGNVRELENAIERAVVLCGTDTIEVEDLPPFYATHPPGSRAAFVPGMTMHDLERVAIQQTLELTGGSTAKAAEILAISQRKIQYRVKEWNLREQSNRSDEEESDPADGIDVA
ncbi:MAG: sigma-54 dependent transcriptional regulator [Myxococcota bacterium]